MDLIYHTSHCGSTLLAALLSSVKKNTYAEPYSAVWHTENENYFIDYAKLGPLDSLIKMPSTLCHSSVQTSEKKIFLYRTLSEHLMAVFNHADRKTLTVALDYPYLEKVPHPVLRGLKCDTLLKKHVYMWANRVFWMGESTNVYWVDSNCLFLNTHEVVKDICGFFNYSQTVDFSYMELDVKRAGLNRTDSPLDTIPIPDHRKKKLKENHGVYPADMITRDKQIMQACEWIEKLFPSTKNILYPSTV